MVQDLQDCHISPRNTIPVDQTLKGRKKTKREASWTDTRGWDSWWDVGTNWNRENKEWRSTVKLNRRYRLKYPFVLGDAMSPPIAVLRLSNRRGTVLSLLHPWLVRLLNRLWKRSLGWRFNRCCEWLLGVGNKVYIWVHLCEKGETRQQQQNRLNAPETLMAYWVSSELLKIYLMLKLK